MSRIFVMVCICIFSSAFWGCNGIEQQASPFQMTVLPVAPDDCQALYRVPATSQADFSQLVFPEGTSRAELPAEVTGDNSVSCTLVVLREDNDKRRAFWRLQTSALGFVGQVQCTTEDYTSPMFDVKAQRSRTSGLYTYASVAEQDQVKTLLQAGKITATWHKGQHSTEELYERSKDGSLHWKQGMTLYKACHLD